MNILITGGTGFIGNALCQTLLNAGHSITVLTRGVTSSAKNINYINNLESLTEIDAVINLAGESLAKKRWNTSQKQIIYASRINLTQQLIQWLSKLKKRPRVLISGSAIGYYGYNEWDELNENSPNGNDFSATLCRDWESAAFQAHALDIRVCCLRIGVVLGKNGGALSQILPSFKLGAGGQISTGKQWFSWVSHDDVIRMIIFLLDNPECFGSYNGTAPNPVTNQEFSQTLAKLLNRPCLLPMPAAMLKLLLGEFSELLINGQKVMPKRLLDAGFIFKHHKIQEALQASLG